MGETLHQNSFDEGGWSTLGWRFLIGLYILILIAVTSTGTILYSGYNNPNIFLQLGPWGDFVAGLLNPILSFLTFFGVLLTLVYQRMELNLSRQELVRSADALEGQIKSIEKQSFETTYFEMLTLHNSIVNSIDIVNIETNVRTEGRDCFKVFYTRLTKTYRKINKNRKHQYSSSKILELSYYAFWKKHQLELGHYFRFLYNFIKLIDESVHAEPYHIKLLRAQLSDQELLLLYYNCISDSGANFQQYAEKYALFDNLPVVRLLSSGHKKLLKPSVFGENPMLTSAQMHPNSTK